MDRAIVAAVAAKYGLDADLLGGQVLVESSGAADAFRYEPGFYTRYIRGNPAAQAARFGPLAACSFGPLQILLEVAVEIGFAGPPEYLFDFATGLEWGARRLAMLRTAAHGDIAAALAAYNGGAAGNMPGAPLRNQAYVGKVFAAKARYVAGGAQG